MLTTALAFLVLGGLILGPLLLSAWCLRLGVRWAKATPISYKRAVVGVLLMGATGLAVNACLALGQDHWNQASYERVAVIVVANLVATWAVLQWFLRVSLGKAILAWLPTVLAHGASVVVVMVLIRPFVFEAFVVPTNSMAPTLVGEHYEGTCRSCGGVGYVPAIGIRSPFGLNLRGVPRDAVEDQLGICGRCLRASGMSAPTKTFHGDRLLAAKFLRPRRWDLITFRYPEEPSTMFVKRLVGLPGEEIEIKNGNVWVDGAPLRKPDRLKGLVYVADPRSEEVRTWGPEKLGRGEYFVLGDFSRTAKDSRLWETGAPGHPRYAVPESYINGVVTHIYWPPWRWRVFR